MIKYKVLESKVYEGQARNVGRALTAHIMPFLEGDDILRITMSVTRSTPRCIHMDQITVDIGLANTLTQELATEHPEHIAIPGTPKPQMVANPLMSHGGATVVRPSVIFGGLL